MNSPARAEPNPAEHLPVRPGRDGSWNLDHDPALTGDATRWLLQSLRAYTAGEPLPAPAVADTEGVLRLLKKHGLAGVLGSLAARGLFPESPLGEQAKHRYLSSSLHHEQAMALLQRLEQAASRLRIPCVVFKGPVLVEQAYGDSGVRSFGDVDAFVGSREAALRLVEAIGGEVSKDAEDGDFMARMIGPGKIECECGDWTLELAFPVSSPTDPMQQFFCNHRDELLAAGEGGLLDPDLNLHFAFLILHMAVNHLCTRFVWFLDLVVMLRRHGSGIRPDRLREILGPLGMETTAAAISRFCRLHIDPTFPELGRVHRGWNTPFFEYMLDPGTIVTSVLRRHHKTWWRSFRAGTIYSGVHFLLSDPRPLSALPRSLPTRWSTERYCFGVRWTARWQRFIVWLVVMGAFFTGSWLYVKLRVPRRRSALHLPVTR